MRFQKSIAAVTALLACALYLTVLSGANSPVADAAMRGDVAGVRAQLAQKADVNAQQADGTTAVLWAAYRNDLAMMDVLLAAKANVRLTNRDFMSPLRLAALNGNPVMIDRLLKAGAHLEDRGAGGETALMFAARNGNPAAVKALVDAGADVNTAEQIRGTTALMWAAEQGHAEAMKVLIANGANVAARSASDTKGARAYLAPATKQRAKDKDKDGKDATDGQFNAGGQGKGGGKGFGGGGGGYGKGGKGKDDDPEDADAAAQNASFGRTNDTNGGQLTALIFAARQNCIECARVLLDAGADVNQVSKYGWSPLLTATQNRNYKLASLLLDRGANPNLKNKGGWSPLYLATDNRNIEIGDYPTPKPDMDQLEYIKKLLAKGADPNLRLCGDPPAAPANGNANANPTPVPLAAANRCTGDSTETRTNFTMQWLFEEGATPFLRAAQSSDIELMKVLLDAGADPKIPTAHDVTALSVASGVAWVEGITFEWSKPKNIETVKLLLSLGLDPNKQDDEGRAALHGAGHKGYTEVIQLLVDAGAKLDVRDLGSRDTVNPASEIFGQTWMPVHYAQGLVRVGVQSAIGHPEAAALLEKLMKERGIPIPEPIRRSICVTPDPEKGCQ
jgi:ankyrin repeat protein